MSFLELVKTRRSIRQFESREIEQEKIKYIMECVRLAPSAANYQPWTFYIVKNEETKRALQASYPRAWFAQAPLYIVACADKSKSWKRTFDSKDFADVDLAIAIEHLCLAATEQNLGSCWVCNFDPAACSATLKLPKQMEPIAIIPIGYVANETNVQERKSLDEIIKIID